MVHAIDIPAPLRASIAKAFRASSSARSRWPSRRSTMLRFADSTQTTNATGRAAHRQTSRHHLARGFEVT